MKEIFDARVFADDLEAKRHMLEEMKEEWVNQKQGTAQGQTELVEELKRLKVEQAKKRLEDVERREEEERNKKEAALEQEKAAASTPAGPSFLTSLTS